MNPKVIVMILIILILTIGKKLDQVKIEKNNNSDKTMISWNLSEFINYILINPVIRPWFVHLQKYNHNASGFLKFYSRESSAGGTQDPKITLFYKELLNLNNIISYDTANTNIYVSRRYYNY